MTQRELVIQYMQDFGSITPLQAFKDLGISKLATRVSELRRDGYEINKESVKVRTRYGKTTHVMRYSMEAER